MEWMYGSAARIQSIWRLIYPPQCLSCDALTDAEFALCPECWRETPFLSGVICDACGIDLPGEAAPDDILHCDDCRTIPRPWGQGRAALRYDGNARRLAMALKHGDRHDLARPASRWMVAAGGDLLGDGVLLVPVPLHWTRLLKRRFNQSALLAQAVGKLAQREVLTDALVRVRRTPSLGDLSQNARFDMMHGAIAPHPNRLERIVGRRVVLIDDVMTTGATLAACATALRGGGAASVDVLTLARAGRGA